MPRGRRRATVPAAGRVVARPRPGRYQPPDGAADPLPPAVHPCYRMAMQQRGGDTDPGWGEASRYAAHLDRGWDHLDRGAVDAARRSAEEAHRLRPEDPDALYLLGQVAAAAGSPDEALAWFERALEVEPTYVSPAIASALVALYDLDAPEQAVDAAERALGMETLGPLDALDMQLVAAEAEIRLGREGHAMARLSEMPEHETLEAACRLVALRRDNPDAPLPHPDEMPDPAMAEAAAALFYDPDGEPNDPEEFEGVCQRILELGARLARTWQRLDRPDAATYVARLLVHGMPNAADAWYTLADAHMASGDPETGIRAALRSAILEASDPIPEFVPDADTLRGKVVEMLATAPHPAVRQLVERPVPVFVHVADRVPPELLLDGVDPRVAVLALGPRGGERDHEIMGLSVYRRGLAHHAGHGDAVLGVLHELLYDEVGHALSLSDDERRALLDDAWERSGRRVPASDGTDDDPQDAPGGRRYDA
ncbi:MAG: tetratricopeptide repeat protein [Deltaproteobacteria bacterium]|nr:MAG: tetratricopeptide repeat protein [Deltaproteobacteria bacterium]